MRYSYGTSSVPHFIWRRAGEKGLQLQYLVCGLSYCPGNNESAGKRLSGTTRKGNPWVRRLLIQAAHAAARQKHGFLGALFRRIAHRRGKKRAAMAVAHRLLVIIYHVLHDHVGYQEYGETYSEELERQQRERRLVRQLTDLGYQVEQKAS